MADEINNNKNFDPWKFYNSSSVEIKEIVNSAGNIMKLPNCYLIIEEKELYMPYSAYMAINMFHFNNMNGINCYHVIDNKGTKYSLSLESSFRRRNNGCSIVFNQVVTGDFVEDSKEIFTTTLLSCSAFFLKETNIDNNIETTEIKYNENISIKLEKDDELRDYYPISIEVKAKEAENLFGYIAWILELLYLFIGEMPKEIVFIAIHGDIGLQIEEKPVKKYTYSKRFISHTMIQKINSQTFTKELLTDFMRKRKDTERLFDSFLDASNSEHYAEIACVRLLDALQGYVEYLDPSLKKSKDMQAVLKRYISNGTDTMKMIFTCDSNKKLKHFRERLRIFRNYHSHYDSSFITDYKGADYAALRFRLELLMRVVILDSLSTNIDETLFKETLAQLDTKEKENGVEIMEL